MAHGHPTSPAGTVPRQTRRLRTIVRIFVAFAGIILALALAELSLAVIYPTWDDFWQPDPVLGHAHIPGKTGVWRSSCFTTSVRLNAWGFRGSEWSREKPTGTTRVVVLGDSLVEGFQVPVEDTLTARLERKLNATSPQRGFEVLNLGVSSYGTGQNYLNLIHRGFAFEPDVVLLGFSITTDVREDSPVLDGRRDRPYVRVGPAGVIIRPFPYPPPHHAFKDKIRQLHLYRVFGMRLLTSPWARRILLPLGLAEPLSPELEAELRREDARRLPWDFTVYAKAYPPAWEEAWDIVSGLLGRVNSDIGSRGGRLIVFGVPAMVEVLDGADVEKQYPGFGAGYDVERPHRMLGDIARRHHFEYFSLQPVFRTALGGGTKLEDLYLPCDAHLARLGHELIADALFARLANRFVSPSGSIVRRAGQ